MASIFKYTSYREFLHDYYKEQKDQFPYFSYQYFANQAKLRSKTFIYKVIKGKKALGKNSTFKIAKAIGLKKRETDYLEAMVSFNNARGIDEKEYYFNNLQLLSKNHKSARIRRNHFSYFTHWYNVVLRELVTIINWKEDYKLLAKMVNPPITPAQAKRGVALLLKLDMITKTESGRYIQTKKVLTTGENVKSLAVQKYQIENLKRASESIERYKKEVRDISTLTVGISHNSFMKIKDEIKILRDKIIEIAHNEKMTDRVYQMNFQLFPVSQLPKD